MGSGVAIGSVLGGRYRLIDVLGEGSMSTVYRAERDDRSPVAVKVLKKKIHNPQAATERLFREARVISRLDHPGCVRMLDWGVDGGRPFVVLELVEGEALNEVLKREKRVEPERAVAIVIAVCDVLEAAHELGVVHRDLKPGNVMLLSGATVKVLDFGLARLAPKKKNPEETQPKELTRPGSTLGTPSYMAPEQVRGSHVDGRADIYACGVILFELICGQLPIVGETAIDTMLKQATDPPTQILDVVPELEPRLAELVMRCLEKKPESRHQTARALRQDLLHLTAAASHPDATTTFVRGELDPAEQTSTVIVPVRDSDDAPAAKHAQPTPTLPKRALPKPRPPQRSAGSSKAPPPAPGPSAPGPSAPGGTAPAPSVHPSAAGQAKPDLPKPSLPKPKAPPSRSKRPPPPGVGERPRSDSDTMVQEDSDPDPASRILPHDLGEKSSAPAPLPLPMPMISKVHVMEAEATKIHARPPPGRAEMPDLSEMEVTIPAHGGSMAPNIHRPPPSDPGSGPAEHTFERTIPVTSMKSPSIDRATALHDMADWASTQKIKRVREADLDLPDATRPMRIKVEGPPPSRPSRRGSAPPTSSPGSVRPPVPSFGPPPKLPSMRGQDLSQAALAEVLSGMPSQEKKWLVAAAIAGVMAAVLLAVWLLL